MPRVAYHALSIIDQTRFSTSEPHDGLTYKSKNGNLDDGYSSHESNELFLLASSHSGLPARVSRLYFHKFHSSTVMTYILIVEQHSRFHTSSADLAAAGADARRELLKDPVQHWVTFSIYFPPTLGREAVCSEREELSAVLYFWLLRPHAPSFWCRDTGGGAQASNTFEVLGVRGK